MSRKEWLRKEISMWRDEGVIGDDIARKLLRRYERDGSKISLGAVLSGAFGALLMGLGVISLFAANWDDLNRPARAAVAVAPLAICALASICASQKNVKTMAFWEPVGIFWCVSIGAACCLVAQTYQVGGSVPGLILLVALLSLPVVWTVKSVVTMAFWPIYVIAWTFAVQTADGKSFALLFKAFAFLLLSLPAYVAFVRRKPPAAAMMVGQIVTGLVYTAGAAIIAVASFPGFVSHKSGIYIVWACSAAVLLAGVGFRLPCWPFVATLVASFAALFSISFPIPFVLSLALGAGAVVYGVSKVKLSYLNVGAALLLSLVIAKFFETSVSFTVKGLVLISAGVLLTFLNVIMLRLKKRETGR